MARTSLNDSWAVQLPAVQLPQERTACCAIPPASDDITDVVPPARSELERTPAGGVVIAFVGLDFEARIASGPDTVVICRNSETEIAASLNRAIDRGARGIVSFGVAGGLAPHLRPGDWVVASSVIDEQQIRPTDQAWSKTMLGTIPGATHAPIAGVDTALTHPEAKRRMHLKSGAAAVDMESHLVARLALAHRLSFAAVRVIIDPAHRVVPEAALAGMRPGGGTSTTAVMRELIAHPSQLPGLLRIAVDAYAARRALLHARRMLGPGFGFRNPGEI